MASTSPSGPSRRARAETIGVATRGTVSAANLSGAGELIEVPARPRVGGVDEHQPADQLGRRPRRRRPRPRRPSSCPRRSPVRVRRGSAVDHVPVGAEGRGPVQTCGCDRTPAGRSRSRGGPERSRRVGADETPSSRCSRPGRGRARPASASGIGRSRRPSPRCGPRAVEPRTSVGSVHRIMSRPIPARARAPTRRGDARAAPSRPCGTSRCGAR